MSVLLTSLCFCYDSTFLSTQDFINQLVTMEMVIAEARSLKAKFAVNEEEDKGQAADELEK